MKSVHIIHLRVTVFAATTRCGRPAALDTVDKSLYEGKWRYCLQCLDHQNKTSSVIDTAVFNGPRGYWPDDPRLG